MIFGMPEGAATCSCPALLWSADDHVETAGYSADGVDALITTVTGMPTTLGKAKVSRVIPWNHLATAAQRRRPPPTPSP